MRKMEGLLHAKLMDHLVPEYLELLNESPNHGLSAAAEKHFRAVIVSSKFAELSRVERHRLVHEVLADELRTHVHALSVQAFTPSEWQLKATKTHVSPECLGGGKRK